MLESPLSAQIGRLPHAVVRGRGYDVVAHQQAAMPEQLAPPAADPDHDDQGPEAGRQEAIGVGT